MVAFQDVDNLIQQLENIRQNPVKLTRGARIQVGVDLGTAFTMLVVCDEHGTPICCRFRRTDVVRDGLVVDFVAAKRVVAELKQEAEEILGIEITQAAIAVPPGTSSADTKTHRYVVEGAGMEVIAVEDEPTAANRVLNIQNGAVVDIGGGTTGISIFENGKVIYTADEATGGTHFTYVIAGHYKIKFEEADQFKVDLKNHKEVFSLVIPVVSKVSSIVKRHIHDFSVDRIVLCGGTSCLEGIESIIEQETGIKTEKPQNPFYVTPIGIALCCPLYTV
ncbi:MAG: ethanolamine utilization protein EutJ [Brevinema sp.]